jgi:aldehyde dehydrogenase (NAD(P)+)
MPGSSFPALDADLATLHDNRTRWAQMPIAQKLTYLRAFIDGTAAAADAQVAAACAAKGITPGTPQEAEEYFGGPVVQIRTARLLAESLERLDAGEPVVPTKAIECDAEGRTWVQVFPTSRIDALSFAGFTAKVRMPAAVTPTNLTEHIATF